MIIPANKNIRGDIFLCYNVTSSLTIQKFQEKAGRFVHLRKSKHLLSQVFKRCSDVVDILVVDEQKAVMAILVGVDLDGWILGIMSFHVQLKLATDFRGVNGSRYS